jgi:hypothetical protein
MLAKKSDDLSALQSALRVAQDGVDAAKAAAAASAKKCAELEAMLRGKDAGTGRAGGWGDVGECREWGQRYRGVLEMLRGVGWGGVEWGGVGWGLGVGQRCRRG